MSGSNGQTSIDDGTALTKSSILASTGKFDLATVYKLSWCCKGLKVRSSRVIQRFRETLTKGCLKLPYTVSALSAFSRFRPCEPCLKGKYIKPLPALHDCALGISPVPSYSGVKRSHYQPFVPAICLPYVCKGFQPTVPCALLCLKHILSHKTTFRLPCVGYCCTCYFD